MTDTCIQALIVFAIWILINTIYLLLIWHHAKKLLNDQQNRIQKEASDLMEKYPHCETYNDIQEEIRKRRLDYLTNRQREMSEASKVFNNKLQQLNNQQNEHN